jgi:hypothetical protein
VGHIPFSISLVTDNRVSNTGEMYAYLMFPARQQINFQQGKVFRLLQHMISRMG